MARRFHLIWFTWHGPRDWDLPGWGPTEWTKPQPYVESARLLEEHGCFDAVIFADGYHLPDTFRGTPDTTIRYGLDGFHHDPMMLLAIMSQATTRLGFVGTANTSAYPPELLARYMSTLNDLSRGRVGWNVVTGLSRRAAENLGAATDLTHDDRYDMSDRYVELCEALWAGRDEPSDGAAHLAVPPCRYGSPVIVQAGGSARGRQFAATHADLVITHQNTVDDMRAYRDDIRARAMSVGRDPDNCKVIFTVTPFVGEDAADAAARRASTSARPTRGLDVGLSLFSGRIGVDLAQFDLDAPVPETSVTELSSTSTAGVSHALYRQHYKDGKAPTLRQVALQEALKETHPVEGDPAGVAEQLAGLMEEVGGDGVAIRGSLLPATVSSFVERVVPELRRLGVVRTEYRCDTLRDNLRDLNLAGVA